MVRIVLNVCKNTQKISLCFLNKYLFCEFTCQFNLTWINEEIICLSDRVPPTQRKTTHENLLIKYSYYFCRIDWWREVALHERYATETKYMLEYSPSPVTHSGLTTSNWWNISARNTRRFGLRSWWEWNRSFIVRWSTRSDKCCAAQNSINSCRLCRESPIPTELCSSMSAM